MKKRTWVGGAVFALLALGMVMAGCKHSSGTTYYTVTWAVSGAGDDVQAAEVFTDANDAPLAATTKVKARSDVLFKVNAPAGYTLVGVSAGEEPLEAEDGVYTYAVTAKVTITAEFTEEQQQSDKYSITWAVSGAGSAQPAAVFATETGTGVLPSSNIEANTPVKFKINEMSGYDLVKVTAGSAELTAGAEDVYTHTVTANVTITAEFTAAAGTYSIEWAVEGDADVTAAEVFETEDGSGELPAAGIEAGTPVSFKVKDIAGYNLVGVTADAETLTASGGVYTFAGADSGTVTITAAFADENNHLIDYVIADETGAPLAVAGVTAANVFRNSTGTGAAPLSVADGGSFSFRVNAALLPRYDLMHVKNGADELSEYNGFYTVDGVTGPVTITAAFEAKIIPTYTVNVNSRGEGSSGQGQYEEGDTVTIVAGTITDKGYEFKSWTVTAGTVSLAGANSATATFTMPGEAVTVEAVFGRIDYALNFIIPDTLPFKDKIDFWEFRVADNDTDPGTVQSTAQHGQQLKLLIEFTENRYRVGTLLYHTEDPDQPDMTSLVLNRYYEMPAGDITVTLEEIIQRAEGDGTAQIIVIVDAEFAGFPEEVHLSKDIIGSEHMSDPIKLTSAGQEITGVKWYIDGELITDSTFSDPMAGLSPDGETLVLCANELAVGEHTLTVKVTLSGGNEYSKSVPVTVSR